MASKGKTKSYSQHSEFRHVSVSERQQSHLCGQNLCGAFVRAVLAMNFKESDLAISTTKALHKFQHQNCIVRTVHDSDHDGVVRIFAGHS